MDISKTGSTVVRTIMHGGMLAKMSPKQHVMVVGWVAHLVAQPLRATYDGVYANLSNAIPKHDWNYTHAKNFEI